MTRSGRHLALLLALVLTAAMRVPSLDLPLDRDEGEYATLAQQWPHGALPYRDLLEQKPPLVPLLYRAALGAGADVVGSVRRMAMVWQLATAACLFLLMRALAGDGAAFAATALWAVASSGTRIQGLTANTEAFVTLPVAAAMLLLARRDRSPDVAAAAPRPVARATVAALLAGVLVGVASLAKQPAILALAPLQFLGPGGLRERIRTLLATVVGAALPWLGVLAYFTGRGAGGSAVFCLLSYNLAYAGLGAAGWADRAVGMTRMVLPEQGTLWALAALGALRARTSRSAVPLLVWAAAAVGFVAGSGRFYPHYFVVTVAPLACLAGLWLGESPNSTRTPAVLRFAACFLAVIAVSRTSWGAWTAASPEERSVRIFGIPNFALAGEVAATVESVDPAGRTLWIWGAEPELYALTRRRPANRFLFHYPFTGDAPPWPGGAEEVAASLAAPTTRVAVVADRVDSGPAPGREIADTLGREFSPVYRKGPFVVLLRRR